MWLLQSLSNHLILGSCGTNVTCEFNPYIPRTQLSNGNAFRSTLSSSLTKNYANKKVKRCIFHEIDPKY